MIAEFSVHDFLNLLLWGHSGRIYPSRKHMVNWAGHLMVAGKGKEEGRG